MIVYLGRNFVDCLNSNPMKTISLIISMFSCQFYLAQQVSGKIAHFDFDANTNDNSGNNNHGTLIGGAYTADRFGNPKRACHFDGNDYIDVANAPSLNPINGITISAWYKTTDFSGGGYSPIFTKGFTSHSSPTYQYKLGVTGNQYAGGYARFGFSVALNGTLKTVMTNDGYWEPDRWYHVVGRYNGSTVSLFIDGNQIGTIAEIGFISSFNTDARMGNNTTANDFLHGTVDDLIIFDRGLEDSEILQLYNNVTNISEEALLEDLVKIQPNPCSETVKISVSGITDDLHISICDLSGKLIFEETLTTPNPTEVNIGELVNGIYLVSVKNKSSIVNKKLVVAKQ